MAINKKSPKAVQNHDRHSVAERKLHLAWEGTEEERKKREQVLLQNYCIK